MVPMVVEEHDREIDRGDRTMTDSDFSPTDAEGLAAWFARAEANAAGLRQRLATLGGDWRSPAPEPVRQESKFDSVTQETGWAATTLPAAGKAAVRAGNRHRGRRNGRR
jgi:hypothetical protein